MKKYVLIETKSPMIENETTILSIIENYVHIDRVLIENNFMHILFKGSIDSSFEDIAINMMSDIMTDLRIYESHFFDHDQELNNHITFTRKKLSEIPLIKYAYLNDRILLSHFIKNVSYEHREFILRKYIHDTMMIETIKIYLESDQNTVLASKKLFLHRNTLLQRLDKFHVTTGFDLRRFIDAYLIYSIL